MNLGGTINLTEHDAKIFAVNLTDIEDPMSQAYLKYLSEQKYLFGIVLNSSTDHDFLSGLRMKIISVSNTNRYHYLDIIAKPYGFYKLIFIDMDSLFYCTLDSNRHYEFGIFF